MNNIGLIYVGLGMGLALCGIYTFTQAFQVF